MGVFQRMYNLVKNSASNPREDYLTEIFAEAINDKAIMGDFIKKFLNINYVDIYGLKVETQRTYGKLENHETDSRPDLVIECFNRVDKNKYIIFIESKLGAEEGNNQLQRYCDHLIDVKKEGVLPFLIYLTHKYDPKEEDKILSSSKDINFYQYRWYQIYNWIKTLKTDRLSKYLIEYMEEIGVEKERVFLPQDMYVIQNLDRTLTMIEETMSDEVQEELSKFGKISQSNKFTQLLSRGIYRKFVNINNKLEIGVELYLTEDIYPIVSTALWVSEGYENFDAVRTEIEEYIDKNEDYSLDTEIWPGWIGLCTEKSFVEFLGEEDHIKALQDYYLKGLKNISSFMELHIKKR